MFIKVKFGIIWLNYQILFRSIGTKHTNKSIFVIYFNRIIEMAFCVNTYKKPNQLLKYEFNPSYVYQSKQYGISIWKVVPILTSLVKLIVPFCRFMASFTIDSPSPVPEIVPTLLERKNGV